MQQVKFAPNFSTFEPYYFFGWGQITYIPLQVTGHLRTADENVNGT